MSSHSARKPQLSTSYLPVPSNISPASSEGNNSPLLPPYKPPIYRHSTNQSVSQRTPFLSPEASTTNVSHTNEMRLLMPTVRPARGQPSYSPTYKSSASTKSSPAKISRSRAGSTGPSLQPSPDLSAAPPVADDWIGGGCRFEVVEEHLELEGYQIYAVEKWIVERKRLVTVLTVFTGDPAHKVTVTAVSPMSSLSQIEAQAEWDKAIHQLRRDGARAKQTGKGTIMVTSLANFRSDYTIVHIPNGDFLSIREQLYTNINVLRMGCSGRSALTLEQPSDTTKDRFMVAYHISDKMDLRSSNSFNTIVIELVKLIQSALSICGLFDLSLEERNGLLCDITCEGIQRWVAEIGEPCAKVEPTERVADPSVVSALFSTILTVRNRLHAMGHFVPKDPFIDPFAFIKALSAFGTVKTHGHNHTLSLPHHFVSSSINISPFTYGPSPPVQLVYLSQPLIEAIANAYDKAKQNDTYKVHRVLINKLDDLATDLRNTETGSGKGLFGGANNFTPTTDLAKFVKVITESSKDGAPSLRYLWTGRPADVVRKRKEKEAIWSEGEEKEREKEHGKDEKEKAKHDKDKEKEKDKERDPRSSDDEGDFMGGMPWSGRMQRRIGGWTALGRTKKLSADFNSRTKSIDSPLRGQSLASLQTSLPSVVISREPGDDDDFLTSGQVSPVSDSTPHNPFMLGVGNLPHAEHSTGELSDYDRKVTEFNQRNPPQKVFAQARVVSWADPQTARDALDDGDSVRGERSRGPSPFPRSDGRTSRETMVAVDEGPRSRRKAYQTLKPRRSFDDADSLRGTRILPIERMRIDVELCGQALILRRREEHLANVIACLRALTTTLSESNSVLRQDYTAKQSELEAVQARATILQEIEAARARADAMTQETNALAYESAQYLVDDLWHMAAAPREKVLAMRERVFGTGRRLPQGVQGAHGRFNRVQWTLDGRTRLVDVHGRTESEAEEEEGLPRIRPLYKDDDGDVVEHPTLKPTWLLRWFNYWGSKWGTPKSPDSEHDADHTEGSGSSPATGTSTALDIRSPLIRNHTA